MPPTILGLDIGGANLKAATADRRAASIPFPLWKHPDRLPAALGELVARFPDAGEFAVTMTGELCDCYETKRQGVNAILDAVEHIAAGRRVRVWSTGEGFADVARARANYLAVAAANWHALATFAGRFAPTGPAKLIDVGSTTADLVLLQDGVPRSQGLTDPSRLATRELVYTGVRRTPVAALLGKRLGGPGLLAAELFATTLDVYLLLGLIPEDALDTGTADGRPATKPFAHARLARMLGGDAETIPPDATLALAREVELAQLDLLATSELLTADAGGVFLLSGSGEFLARRMLARFRYGSPRVRSLADLVGPDVSGCAPAFALAVLATEKCL